MQWRQTQGKCATHQRIHEWKQCQSIHYSQEFKRVSGLERYQRLLERIRALGKVLDHIFPLHSPHIPWPSFLFFLLTPSCAYLKCII